MERNYQPFLTELISKVKRFENKPRSRAKPSLYRAYNAIERRRSIFQMYALEENSHAIRRLRNSKHFTCGNVFEIRGLKQGKKSRDIRDENNKLIAMRLHDTDSDGREMVYSLGGWD